jgi:hypothetical protein
MVYNEEKILPFFLRHYEHLPEIHVLFETDSDDRSYEILTAHPKVKIEKIHIAGGIDDVEKVKIVNQAIFNRRFECEWLYVVDSDEFIFPEKKEDDTYFLARQAAGNYNVVMAFMHQVYRNKDDEDLDPTKPPVPQRMHGDPDLFSTRQAPNRDCNAHYIKPIVIRPISGVQFAPGNHLILDSAEINISPDSFAGAHWQMADVTLALDRRMKRKTRMSENNRKYGFGFQHHQVSEEWIINECQKRMDSPLILDLVRNYQPKR